MKPSAVTRSLIGDAVEDDDSGAGDGDGDGDSSGTLVGDGDGDSSGDVGLVDIKGEECSPFVTGRVR